MDRRSFLRRASLALPALLVGDAALEAFERLSHRKVFALGGLPNQPWHGLGYYFDDPNTITPLAPIRRLTNYNAWPKGVIDLETSSSVHRLTTKPLLWKGRVDTRFGGRA